MIRLSIIIPVYNEEKLIEKSVKRILQDKCYTADTEIIVVDGDKNGSTIASIDNDSRIIRIISEQGRYKQLNAGAAKAAGDVLLFLHADCRIPEGAAGIIKRAIEGGADFGAFTLAIDSAHLFFRIIELAARWRCLITGVPYGDQAFFIRKDVFTGTGGFPPLPVMEDVEFVKMLRKKNGIRMVILKDKVVTSARRWEEHGFLKTLIKNRLVSLLYSLGVSPLKLKTFREGPGKEGLIVFVKYPEEGKVKTRIGSVLGNGYTLGLYRNFVADIIKKTRLVRADLLVYFSPAGPGDKRRIMGWLGSGVSIFPQKGGDLGERMENAFIEQFGRGYRRLVLIGSDIPHMPAARLGKALSLLIRKDAVVGPALDGGYYLIGFKREKFFPDVFKDMPWSTSNVMRLTGDLLNGKGIKTAFLKKMRDIDTAEDLEIVLKSGDMPLTRAFVLGSGGAGPAGIKEGK
jgi:rSAM/selenodomain-associated transferase 2/rSAM/selenodomain-associated transferase 1